MSDSGDVAKRIGRNGAEAGNDRRIHQQFQILDTRIFTFWNHNGGLSN